MDFNIMVDKNFLAHHGLKGMKWGVHNEETKLKYGEISSLKGGGGGGSDEDSELDKSPEDLLKAGKIDEKTAKELRRALDEAVAKSENGDISAETYGNLVNAAYKKAGLPQPYTGKKMQDLKDEDRVVETTGKTTYNYGSKKELMDDVAKTAKDGAKRMVEARKRTGSGSSILEAVVRRASGSAGDAAAASRSYDAVNKRRKG